MKLAVLGTGFIITDALTAISEVEGSEKNANFAGNREIQGKQADGGWRQLFENNPD